MGGGGAPSSLPPPPHPLPTPKLMAIIQYDSDIIVTYIIIRQNCVYQLLSGLMGWQFLRNLYLLRIDRDNMHKLHIMTSNLT